MEVTADAFLAELDDRRSEEEREKIGRYFKTGEGEYGEGDVFIGVRMGEVFALAKRYVEMPPAEIERLLESEVHEARAGACSIMAKQAARRHTSEERRGELFELYLRRLDLAARDVVGRWLADKPRDPLYRLTRSDDIWARRTAIYATSYFIRRGELDETYRIAVELLADEEELVQKAVGGWLREAGKHDPDRLLQFLDENAARMPTVMLGHAVERLEPERRAHYRSLGRGTRARGSIPP
jgi:hypothetical protein